MKMVGTARNGEHARLKSGVPIIKNAVVHIDNLDPNCTKALLADYLLAADAEGPASMPSHGFMLKRKIK